jgi:kynureninase
MTGYAIDPTLARYREDYPILAHTTYMNSNSMGAMPRTAIDGLRQYTELWAREGVEAWDHWPALHDEVADQVGRFFGGGPGETVLNQNVAFFQAALATALDYQREVNGKRKRKVVMEALQFPNVIYVWDRFRDYGAELSLVPSDDGMTVPTERILDAIDEETAVVPISHGIYVSGALQDVKAITQRAHEVGAIVMVDVYQTVGAVPMDVREWGVDALVGGSHKWLCGGPGTAFMWMKPELRESLKPKTTGWMGHAAPFAFEPAPIRYASNNWHFMGGTPSIPAYYVAREAYKNLLEIGVDRIRAHNVALCQRIIDRALAAGLTVHSPLDHAHRTGFVAVDFPTSEAASKALIAEHYKLDWRPNCGLRLGPHFYTTEEEVDRIMTRIEQLAR